MKNILKKCIYVVPLIALLLISHSISSSAQTESRELYLGGNEETNIPQGQATFHVFETVNISYLYETGRVCLSSSDTTCEAIAIDDAVSLKINGAQVLYRESRTEEIGPFYYGPEVFSQGLNEVTLELIDLQGSFQGGSPIHLIPAPDQVHESLRVTEINLPPRLNQQAGLSSVYPWGTMNEPTIYEVVVVNDSAQEVTDYIYIDEQVAFSIPDADNDNFIYTQTIQKQVTVPANSEITVEVTVIHQWNWTNMEFDEACTSFAVIVNNLDDQVLQEMASKVASIKTVTKKLAGKAFFTLELIDLFGPYFSVDPNRVYIYSAAYDGHQQSTYVESAPIWITPGHIKQLHFFGAASIKKLDSSLFSWGMKHLNRWWPHPSHPGLISGWCHGLFASVELVKR
ncbi:MAG: hypothetical protein AAF702_44400 [Chloroflexota bacterium]